MALPGIQSASLNMNQPQAAWDAIAAIKATSPFGPDLDARDTSAAATLDAMLPGGYGTSTNLAGGGEQETLAAVTERVRAAQQSTIDLYA